MKKSILFAALLFVLGALTSCLRDDDLELFRHPIHVSGEASPQFGVPVASGELNINDLLSRLSAQYTGYIDTTEEILTLTYSGSKQDTIKATSAMLGKHAPRVNARKGNRFKGSDTVWFPKDTVFADTIAIDFFNDVDYHNQINIEHIWVNLSARAFGSCSPYYRQFIKGKFDRVVIAYEDHDGVKKYYSGFTVPAIEFDNITDTTERNFNSIDVASIVNDMPRKLMISFRCRMYIRSDLIDSIILNNITYSDMLDSLRMTQLIYSAKVDVRMPLSVEFNNLQYNYDLDLGQGLSSINLDSILASLGDGIDVEISKSRFNLTFLNGIPLKFNVNATMQDANGNNLVTVFANENIAASPTKANPANPAQLISDGETKTVMEAILSKSDLEKLKDARKLKVLLKIDSDSKHVCVRRTDYLKMKAYLVLTPSMNVDIPVTHNGIL